MNPVIILENVSWTYSHSKNFALKKINMEIEKGSFTAVLGENGSGKTTFCRLLNGLIPHSINGRLTGKVTVDGIDTLFSSPVRLAEKTGMTFEEPETQLFTARVYDEVAFALENMLFPAEEIHNRTGRALAAVGLNGYEDFSPAKLSGGQKQRLTIAAALAMADKILVLDDPVSQLDPLGAMEILSIINNLRKEFGLTVVMASGSSEDAAEFAEKICVFKNGSLAAYDTPKNIFSDKKLTDYCSIHIPQVSELTYRMAALGNTLPVFPVKAAEAEESVIGWYFGKNI